MTTRLMNCGVCKHAWEVPAEKPTAPVACPECDAHVCACGCGEDLADMRAHALYKGRACAVALARAGYATTRAAKANRNRTGASVHSLDDARRAKPKELTDCDRIAIALKARGSAGIHSHEIRKLGLSGHPSMRISELEERGYVIEHTREFKGRRPGVRYTLISEPGELAKAA